MNLLRRREFLPALAGTALAQPGQNLLRFHREAILPELPFSALLVGSNNDGNTVEGIRYLL